MPLFAPNDRAWSRTFHFGVGPSSHGPRIGGTRPDGLRADLQDDAEYIMTIQLATAPDIFASLFRNCSFDDFIDGMNDGFHDDDRLLAIPHHDDLRRSSDTAFASSVTPHPLVVAETPTRDRAPSSDGSTVPRGGHKFGGEPHSIQEPELPGASQLFGAGYLQIVQVDFPAADDAEVDGDWPFMDGLFNLFWKPPFFDTPYFWYLQK